MDFSGSDIVTQLLTGFAIVVLLYVSMAMVEYLYKFFVHMWRDRVELFPDTYPSGAKMYTAIQNPSNLKAKTVPLSDNQRSGVEFSYSMFINLNSDTFSSGKHYLYHILHKGYSKMYPLMGPGIFCWGDKNTLRVYMNCYQTWNNFCDIDNIPVNNWFHLAVSCKGNTMHVYINGTLKHKLNLAGTTPPYQNYGDVFLFSGRKLTVNKSDVKSLEDDPAFVSGADNTNVQTSLVFDGAAKGLVSRVFYFSYALTYSEIQTMMNMGPSPNVVGANSMAISPYLADTWWTTNGTNMAMSSS